VTATDAIDAARRAFLWACALDVAVRKPGNVSVAAPGHGMTAAQFIASARAAAAPLFARGAAVGERIERAVVASVAAAGCNTNLGIVLLVAPLAAALERGTPPWTPARLRAVVADVLAELDIDDARAAFRAIVHAAPGGLGDIAEHDVKRDPSVDLRTAMRLAAARDRVARQYANGYEDVFAVGVPQFERRDPETAMLAAFLAFLASAPDSHIVRKWGPQAAHSVTLRARQVLDAWRAQQSVPDGEALAAWDLELKAAAINPGTSADLAVASGFVAAVTGVCEPVPPPLAWNVLPE
jgi:triphosphoribosyl-dephospho-CoA synthase